MLRGRYTRGGAGFQVFRPHEATFFIRARPEPEPTSWTVTIDYRSAIRSKLLIEHPSLRGNTFEESEITITMYSREIYDLVYDRFAQVPNNRHMHYRFTREGARIRGHCICEMIEEGILIGNEKILKLPLTPEK